MLGIDVIQPNLRAKKAKEFWGDGVLCVRFFI